MKLDYFFNQKKNWNLIMYSSQLSKYFVFIKFVQILKLMILNIEKFTGYFLGQFYPDMWFFWIRLQAEGGTKKFGNHWPKVMIFLCSPNNKRQAFSVWTIHEGYFDIKRIAVWDFWQLSSTHVFNFSFFFQNQNKVAIAIFPVKITQPLPNSRHRGRAGTTCLRALCS